MNAYETSQDIDDQAADWAARRDRAPLSEEENRQFEAWLSGDPRRRGAFLRADALAMLSESAQALGSDFKPQDFAPATPPLSRGLSRRKMLAWTGAGGVAAASLAAFGLSAPAFGAITTRRGEVRLVTLEDGSSVMLNTETSVKVRYTELERRVHVLYGEAYFTIVADPHRPFTVDVASAHLNAAPGTLRVRNLQDAPVDILVNQGRAMLKSADLSAAITLPAGTRIALPLSGGAAIPMPQPAPVDLVSRELAWREGKIAFEGERLDQAAAQFARYSRTRIAIPDPSLAAEPVSGLFAAADPVGFSRAVAAIFDAKLDQSGDSITLTRRNAPAPQ
jgi:transmembrane sensor